MPADVFHREGIDTKETVVLVHSSEYRSRGADAMQLNSSTFNPRSRSCIGLVELVSRMSELLGDHITSLHQILQSFPQGVEGSRACVFPSLNSDVHQGFRRMWYGVAAEFDIWVFVDEVA